MMKKKEKDEKKIKHINYEDVYIRIVFVTYEMKNIFYIRYMYIRI